MASPPPGIYVPVPTFFDSDLSTLDSRLHAAHALYLARSGIRGLILSGSTGEVKQLTSRERLQMLMDVRKCLTDNAYGSEYPLILGVASESIDEAIHDLHLASDYATYGLVLAPNYFASTGRNVYYQEGLVQWYTKVADASPIPILIYHYPAVSNSVQIATSTFVQLARHPNIVGCKLSHGDISKHIQLSNLPDNLNNNFSVFTGMGQQLFPVLSTGGCGAIDGFAGIFPLVMTKLYDMSMGYIQHPSAEQLKPIRELQNLVSKAEDFVVEWGTVGIKVAVGKFLGVRLHGNVLNDKGQFHCRSPLAGGLPDEEWVRWECGILGEMARKEEELGNGVSGHEGK